MLKHNPNPIAIEVYPLILKNNPKVLHKDVIHAWTKFNEWLAMPLSAMTKKVSANKTFWVNPRKNKKLPIAIFL